MSSALSISDIGTLNLLEKIQMSITLLKNKLDYF